jgi:hypothetical protein
MGRVAQDKCVRRPVRRVQESPVCRDKCRTKQQQTKEITNELLDPFQSEWLSKLLALLRDVKPVRQFRFYNLGSVVGEPPFC